MNFKNKIDLNWMLNSSSLCLILWDRAVDAVWVEQSVLGPAIRHMERHPLAGDPFARIADKIAEGDKLPSRVILCLPRAILMQRTLDYPSTVEADLDSMMQFEAVRHVPMPEAERCIGYRSALWPEEKKLSVNLTAARRADVAEWIERLSDAGLPVDCAVGFSPLVAPADAVPTLMLIADEEHVEAALFADGLLQESQQLARPADDTAKDQLTGTIRRMAAQHSERLGDEGIGRLVFAGPAPLPEEVRQGLSSTFGLPEHGLTLPELFLPALEEFSGDPLSEVLCAAAAEPPPSMNLIERPDRKVPLSRRTLLLGGLCVLLLAELLVGWAVWTHAPAVRLKSVNRKIGQIKRRAAPVQAVRNNNRDLRRELNQLNELSRTRVSSMEILKILSDALPEDTYLEGFSFERGDDLRIRGRSKEPDKLPALLLDLPFVATIEASNIEEKKDEYHGFTLTVALRSMRDE